MYDECDVLVVGAGPSGLSAALSIILNGLKVLIVERKAEVGIPVKCGELLPNIKEVENLLPAINTVKNMYMQFKKDKTGEMIKDAIENAVVNKIKKIRLYSPNNNTFEFNFDGIVINREAFEKSLAIKAKNSGAILKTSTTVEAVSEENGHYKVSVIDNTGGKSFVKARFLIGADGFPSNLAKIMKMKHGYKKNDMVLCAQKRITNIKLMDPDVVEMYLSEKYARGGYAWIIPKSDEKANVGLGVRLSYIKAIPILDCLETFLKSHKIASHYFIKAKSMPAVLKIIPVGGLVSDIVVDRVLLVGDAAGLVIPINGSGIPTALASGYMAGKIVSKCAKGEYNLSAYVSVLRKSIKPMLDRGYLYRKLFDALRSSTLLFERTLQFLGSSGIANIIKCDPLTKIVQNLFFE
jgi:geranylgeranyl reductase family protein